MSVLLDGEKKIEPDEAIIRIFITSPSMQSEWRSAQSTYGNELFPDLHELARNYFAKSPGMRTKWQEYQRAYGTAAYPDLWQQ